MSERTTHYYGDDCVPPHVEPEPPMIGTQNQAVVDYWRAKAERLRPQTAEYTISRVALEISRELPPGVVGPHTPRAIARRLAAAGLLCALTTPVQPGSEGEG